MKFLGARLQWIVERKLSIIYKSLNLPEIKYLLDII